MDEETLAFVLHWKRKLETENFETLGSMLGTNWSTEKINALFTPSEGSSSSSDWGDFIVPLAFLLDDNFMERIKPRYFVGGEELASGEERPDSLMDMPKDEFLTLMGHTNRL